MHRKSIEAAEQLKATDDNNSNASDRDDNNDTTDKSDISTNNSTNTTNNKQNAQETNNNNKEHINSRQQQQQQQQQESYEGRYMNQQERLQGDRVTSQVQSERVLPTDPEEFRNNSIACLRAKAQEHQAKLLSFSTDALMLVNSQRRMNGSCDTHTHNQDLNSSDNSSSLF
jgi:homeobox protein 2